MKKTKRLLSLILSGTMLASTAVFTVNAKDSAPEYAIDFVYDVDAKQATATISVSGGGTYGVGHFGFSYNAEALTLVKADGNEFDPASDMMADVVVGYDAGTEYAVVTTEETSLVDDLIDVTNGDILFGWYVNHNIVEGVETGFFNGADGSKILATVNFKLADEIANSENPSDAILEVEKLITVYDGEEVRPAGWDDIYVVSDPEFTQHVTKDSDIDISSSVSVKMPDITASASGTTINVSWKPSANEAELDIAYYDVVVYDKDGNVVATYVQDAGAEYLTAAKKYAIKFTNDDGIKGNKNYTVKAYPVTASGNSGSSQTKTVRTGSTPEIEGGGGSTSSGAGASLTYTVTYHAGEGTIPEGQKFKYTVNRNGYVGGSPAVIAPEGKIFAGWSVDGVTLISVEVYKITKNITFKAIYVEKEDDTHRPFILGYPGGIVAADASLTRAEAAAIIARASENFDSTKVYTSNFTDVPADHWAANYIAFVYENNIVTGYEDNTYHPSSYITRAEFATIMQRYLGIALNEDAAFTDVGKDHWAVAYIGACKDAGLINGYENGEFRPSNEITRAEAVKILNRATDRSPNPTAINSYVNEKGIPFEDLDSNKWYFFEIMEAAFPHLVSYYH